LNYHSFAPLTFAWSGKEEKTNDRVNTLMHEYRYSWRNNAQGPWCAAAGNRRRAVHAFVVLIMLLALPADLWAQGGRVYLAIDGGYKTGSLSTGTPFGSDLSYLSTEAGYVAPLYNMSISMPYLFSSSRSQGDTTDTSGIGDVVLQGSRVLVPETPPGFSLEGALAVKAPSADNTKGLGTGKADYGGFLSAHQRLADVTLTLFGGGIKTGSPSDVTYNDVYLYGLSVSKVIGHTELSASFQGSRALVPGAQNPQEIHTGLFRALNKDYAIRANAFVGLNNGGPDFGVGVGIIRWF
jgi:hypothetical protein